MGVLCWSWWVGLGGSIVYNKLCRGVEGIVLFFWRNNSWRCEREVEGKRGGGHAWGWEVPGGHGGVVEEGGSSTFGWETKESVGGRVASPPPGVEAAAPATG